MEDPNSQRTDIRRFLSKILFGLLLAGAVYLAAEAVGLGDRRSRGITFYIGARPAAAIEVTYLNADDVVRRATLPVSGPDGARAARDEPTLKAGRYELEIVITGYNGEAAVERRALELGDRDEERVDITQ